MKWVGNPKKMIYTVCQQRKRLGGNNNEIYIICNSVL